MVVIRLRPKGKKRQKTYRIVVDHKKNSLQGKNIEDLGWLNRHTDEFDINRERAEYWLSVGAQPSDSVYNLFVTAGIIDGKKRSVHSTRKRGKAEEEAKEEKPEEGGGETEEKVDQPKEEGPESTETSDQPEEEKNEEKKEEQQEEEENEDTKPDDSQEDDTSENPEKPESEEDSEAEKE